MLMHENKNRGFVSKGFTLVELIMVIVIIGLLAAIIIPRFANQGDAARVAATKANLENIRTAVDLYKANEGLYPAVLPDLTVAAPQTGNIYLRTVPQEKITNTIAWNYAPATGNVTTNHTIASCDAALNSYCTNNAEDPATW